MATVSEAPHSPPGTGGLSIDQRCSAWAINRPGVPVLLFIAAGFALRRRLAVDLRPVSRLSLYVFSPALVLGSLAAPRLSRHDIIGIVAFAVIILAASLTVSRLIGRLVHARAPEQSGLDLTTVFANSANLGLPMVAFSLGQSSLHAAVIFVLTQIVAVNTLGAYLAGRSRGDPRRAFRRMIRLPSLWAMMVAVLLAALHLHLPSSLLNAATFGGQAYAPTVLVVLGGTLADWQKGDLKRALPWISAVVRLMLMPVIAVLIVHLLNITPDTARALVLQIAMPVAVNALILGQEFDAVPNQVGQAIAVSTLGGILTLPAWLWLLPRIH